MFFKAFPLPPFPLYPTQNRLCDRPGYHLEFTRKAGHPAGRAPTEDHLLVFYLPDGAAWEAAVARMGAAGYRAVPAFNPYWDRHGKTFADPDGYRVVFQHAAWSPHAG